MSAIVFFIDETKPLTDTERLTLATATSNRFSKCQKSARVWLFKFLLGFLSIKSNPLTETERTTLSTNTPLTETERTIITALLVTVSVNVKGQIEFGFLSFY